MGESEFLNEVRRAQNDSVPAELGPRPELPSEIAVKVFADRTPLPGAYVLVIAPTRKNPLNIGPFGPTDGHGELRILRNDLRRGWLDASSTGIMDYSGHFGEIFVRPISRDQIHRMRRGYATWGSVYPFPTDFLARLDALESLLQHHEGQELRVVVGATEGSGWTVMPTPPLTEPMPHEPSRPRRPWIIPP